MHWQFNPLLIPMLIALAISVILAFYAKRHHTAPGAITFVWLMLAIAEWLLCDILWTASHEPSKKLFFNALQFLGIVNVPIAWLIFALQFTGRHTWINRRRLVLLSIMPIITLLLVWTNAHHQWVWVRGDFYSEGSLLLMKWEPAPWFWIHSMYSYLLLFIGTVFLVRNIFKSAHIYRSQAVVLLVGLLLPWGANAINIFHLSPVPNFDLTPMAFSLAGLSLAWPIFNFRLFDLVPVARNKLVDVMSDGMIVVDDHNRILDINPAALKMVNSQFREAIGKSIIYLFRLWPEVPQYFQNTDQTHTEICLHKKGTIEHFDVRITLLLNKQGQLKGRLILLRNISEQKLRQEEREKLIHELQETLAKVKTLQNLLPICSSCKKIRDDEGYWEEVETYISKHVDVNFSHGICPNCVKKLYPSIYNDIFLKDREG